MYGARQGGGAGLVVLVPGGLFWTRRRAGVGFRWVDPDTHDYFLPRPGRLSSKSGCRHDYFLQRPKAGRLSSKISHPRGLGPAARRGGVPKVTPEFLPWPVGVLVVASIGWCSKKLSQNPRWGGVPKVWLVLQKVVQESPRLDGVVYQKLGWCSKKLSQNPRWGGVSKSWGGVPKSCPRIPRLDGVVFQKLGWCSKKLSLNPLCVYFYI